MSDSWADIGKIIANAPPAVRASMRVALTNLSSREQTLLELRYGLTSDEQDFSVDEVASIMGISASRVRQMESLSLKKLQSLAEAQKLRDMDSL